MTIYEKIQNVKKENIKLKKDTEGYWYKYATLEQIQEKINPLLHKNWLVIIDRTEDQKVITEIVDIESWEKIKSEMAIGEVETNRITTTKKKLKDKNETIEKYERNSLDPQGVGSIITYYRRYNRVQLLDLEQEDDDWYKGSWRAKNRSSSSKGVKKYNKKTKKSKKKKWFNDKEFARLEKNKEKYNNAKEAIKVIEENWYNISKARRDKIKDLYNDKK